MMPVLVFAAIDAVVGLMLIVLMMFSNGRHIRVSYRLGLWVGAVGLMAQSLRTYSESVYGVFPFGDLPIWVIKDMGYWVIAVLLSLDLVKR